jgi:UDP-N-acetylglucosamine 1-carboxyvinyltransferase
MSRFIIHGQRRLRGTFTPDGNKNAALPMLAAALLTDEPVHLENVPPILDVDVMLELLAGLGVDVRRKGKRLTLQARSVRRRNPDPALCRRVRSSILLAGPLAARWGRAVLPPPGGDIIGRRRLDTHLAGLRALGISTQAGSSFTFVRRRLRGARLVLDEASVTATENILMAAVLAPGRTVIYNAAGEPHVADLGALLIKMGARIRGLGTNCIEVEGVRRLGGARHAVAPDHVEIGSFIAAAAATGGELTVRPAGNRDTLAVIERAFGKLGVTWKYTRAALRTHQRPALRIQKDFGAAIPKIEDGVWPSFPSDLMSVALVLATQARGTILFFEKMFESRMYFVDPLISMGASIVPCDPHRVVVSGPTRLHGTRLTSPDIRAGMALVIAALCARGTSVIENAEIIDRGYARIDEKLRALGADIERAE